MPLGTEVGLDPGDIVLDGDPAPPTEKGKAPPTFRPMSTVAKQVGAGLSNAVLEWISFLLDGHRRSPIMVNCPASNLCCSAYLKAGF